MALDHQKNATDFAHLLTFFRCQRSMSQGQLAQAARLSRTYVYHLETGQRTNPSPQVAQSVARALELRRGERRQLYEAYHELTGQYVDDDQSESALLELGDLAILLVHNTSYPAHSLNKLWYLHSWNDAAIRLFETQELLARGEQLHLMKLVFDPDRRERFRGWESLARRLMSDFQYNTRTLTHLPEYKSLWKSLREYPEFRRIASSVYAGSKPEPSFVFQIQHSDLGHVTLRTATTVFGGISSYSMVSYVPGDQHTLDIYRAYGWQPQG